MTVARPETPWSGEALAGEPLAGEPLLARLAAAVATQPGAIVTLPPGEPAPRRAAVAIVLHRAPEATMPAVLSVKRAEYAGDPWSGHVAFPGGRAEPDDATLWDTAARETWEETGIDLRHNTRLLGALDELYPRTPTLPPIVVRPYVVVAYAPEPLTLSDELAGGFWVPLDSLAAPEVDRLSTVMARDRALIVPSFVIDDQIIWGMTERIVRQLLSRLGEVGHRR